MQRISLKKKKLDRHYSMHRGIGGLNKAQIKVYLETQEDSKHVYQNFRLVTSEARLFQYFTDEAFLGYHLLEEKMSQYYAGDGEHIVFRNKSYYNNLIVVTFDKIDDKALVRKNVDNVQFQVSAPIPATQGCLSCIHFRKSNRLCTYYETIGIVVKENCVDFRQKEVKYVKRKKEDVNRSSDSK